MITSCGHASDTPAARATSAGAAATAATTSTAETSTVAETTHPVAWEQHSPPVAISAPLCDTSGACLFPYRQQSVATGDVEGTAIAAGAASAAPDGTPNAFATNMTSVISGRVGPCGEGTAVVQRWETIDPATGDGSGRWQIVPGMGTGDLASLAGAGVMLPATSTAEDFVARFEGQVSCVGGEIDEPFFSNIDGTTVTYESVTDIPTLGETVCDSAGSCLWPSALNNTVSGDWAGTSIQSGVGHLSTDPASPGYAGTALELFRGTIAGCGAGTLVLRSTAALAGAELTRQWEIVPGYGTGALAAARGSGISTGVRNQDGTYAGSAEGTVTCKP